jgi:putative membrane protein insertion efficiency factor
VKTAAEITGKLLRGLIWLYRHSFSVVLGRHCRFLPTCSDYADEAIRIHGPLKGSGLAFRRLCRCHPFGGHGFDPVPQKGSGVKVQGSGIARN